MSGVERLVVSLRIIRLQVIPRGFGWLLRTVMLPVRRSLAIHLFALTMPGAVTALSVSGMEERWRKTFPLSQTRSLAGAISLSSHRPACHIPILWGGC